MKHTNTPPVYLLCYGQIGQLTETVMPARIRQVLHIVQFPNQSQQNETWKNVEKADCFLPQNKSKNPLKTPPTKAEALLNRLLFSRKPPLLIYVLDPLDEEAAVKAAETLSLLHRSGFKPLCLFLDSSLGRGLEIPRAILFKCLGYSLIQLEGHEEDAQAYRRSAQAIVRQVELLHHLATYPDRKPSFLKMLPLLMKESPQFVLAAGFADENLSVAGQLLSTKLKQQLKRPVQGRSLVMVLSNKHHLGFHEVNIIHNTCATLLGRRMLVTGGGRSHPHLRTGQYLVIGMVNEM